MGKALLGLSLLCFCATAGIAGSRPPISQTELDEISARGKLLARYDAIAWRATDLVEAQHPAAGDVQGYVVKFTGHDWICAFGHLSADRNSLVLAYQVTTDPKMAGERGALHPVNTTDTGDLFHEFLAMDTARQAFGPQTRPYNDAVIPAPAGGYFVYFYPGSTETNVILMGGDVRFRISDDGKSVMEKRQLHASIREDRTGVPSDKKIESAYHTHVLSDVPEDTDVLYVLMRNPPIPEYIASKKFFYLIDPDGTIHYVGETDKVLKK
jgi:hypothetical protein